MEQCGKLKWNLNTEQFEKMSFLKFYLMCTAFLLDVHSFSNIIHSNFINRFSNIYQVFFCEKFFWGMCLSVFFLLQITLCHQSISNIWQCLLTKVHQFSKVQKGALYKSLMVANFRKGQSFLLKKNPNMLHGSNYS